LGGLAKYARVKQFFSIEGPAKPDLTTGDFFRIILSTSRKSFTRQARDAIA
jgi:hypothetical protein